MKITVHDKDYEPALRGRPRRVDISDLLQRISDNPGTWIEAELEPKDAGSVVRQLKKYEDVDVATKKSENGERLVLARSKA